MEKRDFNQEDVARRIRKSGLRATFQRTILLKIILDSNRHPTAEMLMRKVNEQGLHLSMGTIYNTLDRFEEHGLITRVHDFHIHLVDHDHIDDLFDAELENVIRKRLSNKLPDNMQNAKIEVTLYK